MDFSEEIKNEIWRRAGGRCECSRQHPRSFFGSLHQGGRCQNTTNLEFYPKANPGADPFSGYEILCPACRKLNRKSEG